MCWKWSQASYWSEPRHEREGHPDPAEALPVIQTKLDFDLARGGVLVAFAAQGEGDLSPGSVLLIGVAVSRNRLP
jgi:hypothetical protein